MISELQSTIEGDPQDITSGYRPAGISVRVLPAPVQRVNLDVLIVIAEGANVLTVGDNVETAIASLFSSLNAGQPAYIAKIIDVVMSIDDVINTTLYRQGTRVLAVDQYPSTERTVLRGGQINAVTSVTGV